MESLGDLLLARREALVRFCQAKGGRLLRFTTAEDLAQGVYVRALERADGFTYRGDVEFEGWLFTVARTYLLDRAKYWSALKRDAGAVLRITSSVRVGDDPRAVAEPVFDATGPSTFAERREGIVLAARALDMLLERDRKIVQWEARGESIADIASRLGVGYEAARKARTRAFARLRGAYEMIVG